MLAASTIESFEETDPRNSRLPWMIDDLNEAGAFDNPVDSARSTANRALGFVRSYENTNQATRITKAF